MRSLAAIAASQLMSSAANAEGNFKRSVPGLDAFESSCAPMDRVRSPHSRFRLTFCARAIPNTRRLPQIQFIAASIDPTSAGSKASSGANADEWGIWRVDPGPRGVQLSRYKQLEAAGGKARAGWQFDPSNWWLEEHGLIMEAPTFPLPAGKYQVTGGRETSSVLTVNADASWSLSGGATLYDVTHLPCRSAKYTGGSPANAKQSEFPVTPGASSERQPAEHCLPM